MRLSDIVIGALAVASLLAFLHVHSSKLWRIPERAVRHLKLDEAEFQEKRRLLAELYLLEILFLCSTCFLFGVWLRNVGLSWPVALVPALMVGLVVSLLLAPVSLRLSRARDLGVLRLPSLARALTVPAGWLLGFLSRFMAGAIPVHARPSRKAAGETARGPGAGPPAASSASAARVFSAPGATAPSGARPPMEVSAAAVGGTGAVAETSAPGAAEEVFSRIPPIESPFSRDLLRLLLRLRERHVAEVMVPRHDMVCAEENSTIAELAELARESGHTRIPVFAGSIDSIKGYVTAKDVVLKFHMGQGEEKASSIMSRTVFVTRRASIESCLEQMQKEHVSLAVVVERSGRTAGLVTSEDILEEVVGDLYEDIEFEEPAYRVLEDGTAEVRASVRLGDLAEILGAAPEGDAAQTVGDYVRKRLSADPVPGDKVSDDVFVYTIVRTVGRAIWSLRIEKGC